MTLTHQTRSAAGTAAPAWLGLTPGLFVLLWSTGFIGAGMGLPHAEPMTFLAWRFGLAVLLFVAIAILWRAPWPRPREALHASVVGTMLHGVYLGGVFAAIARGMPVGLSALIVGIQPILAALAAGPLLAERVSAMQWLGSITAFAGLVLVVWNKTGVTGDAGWAWDGVAMALCIAALVGITAANIYQKRFGQGQDMRTAGVFQYGAALAVTMPAVLLFETGHVNWTGELVFALTWLVLVLSVGAVPLLMLLIRFGEVSRVTGLFYLVPPVTAIMAFILFGEKMTPVEIVGVGITAVGVALATRPGRGSTPDARAG